MTLAQRREWPAEAYRGAYCPTTSTDLRRFDVTVTDGRVAEHHAGIDYHARNRLVDFAFRHGFCACVRDADPRPRRRTYR